MTSAIDKHRTADFCVSTVVSQEVVSMGNIAAQCVTSDNEEPRDEREKIEDTEANNQLEHNS